MAMATARRIATCAASLALAVCARPGARGAEGGDAAGTVVLGPEACQCLASRNATVANLLEIRRWADESDPPRKFDRGAGSLRALRRDLLALAALEARNRSAGAALELYHQLAGVEARREFVRLGLAELDDALAKVGQIRERGLARKIDEGALRRQRLDLVSDGLELELARGRLHGELQTWIKLGPRAWVVPPTIDPVGVAGPVDVRAAVAVGLTHRPELRLLRRVRQSLTVETLPAARLVLARADPILGSGSAQGGPIGFCRFRAVLGHSRNLDSELCAVRAQLDVYLADREQSVASEIARAAETVAIRDAQVEVAREQVRSWEAEVDRAEDRTRQGLASFAEALPARAGLLKARATRIGREVDRAVAGSKLRQAQGLLAEECGSCGPATPRPSGPGPGDGAHDGTSERSYRKGN